MIVARWRSLRHTATAASVVVLAACAHGGAEAPTPAGPDHSPAAPAELHAPARVAGLVLADSVRYPDPELGAAYRYTGDERMRVDTYIYPREPESTLVTEAASFRAALEIYRRRGRVSDYRVATENAWSPVEWAEGREVVAVLERDGGSHYSYYHVLAVGDQFVKVRITAPEGAVSVADARGIVEAFLRGMAER